MFEWLGLAFVIAYVLWRVDKMHEAAIYRWSQQMQILQAIHSRLQSIEEASEAAAHEAAMIAERKRRARNQERLTG